MNTTRTISGTEPVTLSEVKNFLKLSLSSTTDDVLLAGIITAAREQAEDFCNRSFIVQDIVYQETIAENDITGTMSFRLPYPNHLAIDTVELNGAAIAYTTTGLNKLVVNIQGVAATDGFASVQIEYSAGDCQYPVKFAILNLIREMYFNRSDEAGSEKGLKMLLPHKCYQ